MGDKTESRPWSRVLGGSNLFTYLGIYSFTKLFLFVLPSHARYYVSTFNQSFFALVFFPFCGTQLLLPSIIEKPSIIAFHFVDHFALQKSHFRLLEGRYYRRRSQNKMSITFLILNREKLFNHLPTLVHINAQCYIAP